MRVRFWATAPWPRSLAIVVERERPWIEPHVVETTNANGPSGVTDEDGLPLCNCSGWPMRDAVPRARGTLALLTGASAAGA